MNSAELVESPQSETATPLKIQHWRHTQKHYTVNQVADMWQMSYSTIHRLFRGEPGVLHLGNLQSRRRTRISLRIPQDVAERVHRKLTSVAS